MSRSSAIGPSGRRPGRQAAGHRPAQRYQPLTAGELQRRLADRPGPVDGAGAAQRRGQHHLALGAMPRGRRWRAASSTATRRCGPRSAPSPPAIASSAATQARRTASRCGASRHYRVGARQQRRRGGQPPDAQRVGRQPGQRVAGGLGSRRRPAPVRDRPSREPGCASRAGAETTRVRYAPARPATPDGAPRSSAARSLRALRVTALPCRRDRT